MTTGSIVSSVPRRVALSGSVLTTDKSRVWSGGDDPSTPPRHERASVLTFQPPKTVTVKRERYKYVPAHRDLASGIFFPRTRVLSTVDVQKTFPGRWAFVRESFTRPPKRAGRRPENHYGVEYFETRLEEYRHLAAFGWQTNGLYKFQLQDPSGLWDANEDLKLFEKLQERIAGSNFHVGVTFHELPKALDTIATSAKALARAFLKLKKGHPYDAMQVLVSENAKRGRDVRVPKRFREDAASNWLQMQYGYKPLVNDLYSAAVFVDHQMRYPFITKVSASRKVSRKDGPFLVVGPYWNGVTMVCEDTGREVSKRITAYIKEINVPSLVGLTDPASVVWELTPFSFVADWAFPIGSFLNARRLDSAVTGYYVVTTKTRSYVRGPVTPRPSDTWMVVDAENSGADYLHQKVTFSREIFPTLPYRAPTIKSPAKTGSPWTRAANAVALLTSVFSGRP